MLTIAALIIGAGWGIIIHDLAILEKQIHAGDEIDITINDFMNSENPHYE